MSYVSGAPRFDPPGVHEHDGFFLRLTGGFGGGGISLDTRRAEVSYVGGGWSGAIDLGGSPIENLVIHGRLRGAWMFEPTFKIDDDEIDDVDNVALNQVLFGPGVQYYFMPINLYVGGVIGFAQLEVEIAGRGDEDNYSERSKVGFGFDIDVGKEWWVGDNWGIGAAARFSLSTVPVGNRVAGGELEAEDIDDHFVATYGSLLFTATYQ